MLYEKILHVDHSACISSGFCAILLLPESYVSIAIFDWYIITLADNIQYDSKIKSKSLPTISQFIENL